MGGFPNQLLTPKKQIHLVIIKNNSEGFRLLLSGKIEAVASNKWVGAYILQQEGFEGIKVIQKPFVTTYAPMGVKKGNLKLLNELNEGIRKLKKAGTIDEIARRWSSQEIVFMTKEKIREILTFVGIAVIIIVVFIIILWAIIQKKQNNKLRQEIAERQRAEEALEKYQKNLENLVTTRTVELSTANEQLQQEIKEHKQTEEALRESQSFLVKAQEIAKVGSWKWQSDTDEGIWSDQTFRILGYAPNEIQPTYKWLLGLMHPDDREPVMKGIEESMSTGESFDMEYRLTGKDQKGIVVHSRGEVVSNQAGDAIGMIGAMHDITELKQAEETLKESEKRYRALFEDNPIETIVVDKDARITMYNRAKRTSGDRLPRIGDVMYKDYAASHLTDMQQELMQCIQLGKSKDFPDRNYKGRFLDIKMFPFEDGAIITSIDQTEKKNLEAKLRRTQKMESLGLMAGGIAHDLNNILSGIVSYPELLLMDLSEDSPLRKPIETIKESGMRAADVVSDLLTIARGVATGKEVLNLNTMIEECLSSAEHQELKTVHSLITFKTEFDSDLLNISCSPTHIKKSLTNLITNASEAIEGSGAVTISTENRYLDEPLKGYEDVRRGEYAVLTVSDDGSGISANDLERIFEPFYTKKVMGRSGTGLGLAVVWNTVQDHDGYINIKTNKKGTAFELYFPVTRDEVGIEGEAVPVKDYLGHGERVLVVDDEKRQREIACGILTKLGYNAEAVSSGEEAVEYLKEQSVDLIILDMIMPKGINGRETYERIIKIHPVQKAIIASGFSETADVKKAQKLGAGKYIKKPYTMEKIGLAAKEELEK